MSENNGKSLRFASFIRVSTDRQEQQGESLQTQRKGNERDVSRLAGRIVERYGGQEHATPGWEKAELDRLLVGATKGKFDAVIVAFADRWSRDNAKSAHGIELFKRHAVRFFVGVTEYDLHNPEHVLFLNLSSAIGQFQAQNQSKKSILSRMERAEQGKPASGKLPFGRTYDRKTGWGVDAKKQEMVQEIAKRYLSGESMANLAREFGVNHASLHKTMTLRCGDTWAQKFVVAGEPRCFTTEIPRLLPEETIEAILRRARHNKTYAHKKPNYLYLLRGKVFCAECGYAMMGQLNPNGFRYYRHAHTDRTRACSLSPRPWVNADVLEECVLRHLFDTFGNPAAIERAVAAATPKLSEVETLRHKQQELLVEVEKVATKRDRLLQLIVKDLIRDGDAEKQLKQLKERDQQLTDSLNGLKAGLENLMTPEQIREAAERVASGFQKRSRTVSAAHRVKVHDAMTDFDAMSSEETHRLIQEVFDGPLPDRRPAGIYISAIPGQQNYRRKKWLYRLHGKIIDGQEAVTRPSLFRPLSDEQQLASEYASY